MSSLVLLFAPFLIGFLALVCYILYQVFILPLSSPLRNLPGPDAKGIFGSHMYHILHAQFSAKTGEEYVQQYGKNIRVLGMGVFDERLWTIDPVAISYVLNRTHDYQKPWQARRFIEYLIGNGLSSVEGIDHARQRRVIGPTFCNDNLQALLPIFFAKAHELRQKWSDITTEVPEDVKLDVCHWFGRAALDVIGLAGFDYRFDAIQDETNEVYVAFKDMFEIAVSSGQNLKCVLALYFPWIRTVFPDERTRAVKRSQEIIGRVGKLLIDEKKQAIIRNEKVGKDLLSRLIKANMSKSLLPSQKITDEDMLNQISTFLSAGSDSTALALTWSLYHLSLDPTVQDRLREELLTIPPTRPEMDLQTSMDFWSQIDSLPLLGNVVKESLRLVPPVHSSIRVAMKDDEIPVSQAVKMKDGSIRWSVSIRKGQSIHVAMEGFNLDREVWGPDAWEFNPDRWDNLPQAVRDQPGVYSNLMTFSAGPRSCLGMKVALIELKTFLHILVSNFTFSNPEQISKANVVLTRPYVVGRWHQSSCPMLVRPYQKPSP